MQIDDFLAGLPLEVAPDIRVKLDGVILDDAGANQLVRRLHDLRPLDIVGRRVEEDEEVLIFRNRGAIGALRVRFRDGLATAIVARL